MTVTPIPNFCSTSTNKPWFRRRPALRMAADALGHHEKARFPSSFLFGEAAPQEMAGAFLKFQGRVTENGWRFFLKLQRNNQQNALERINLAVP